MDRGLLETWKEGLFPAKRRYHGHLIHKCVDEFGPIEVVEHNAQRSLHFGTREKQSAMNLHAQNELVLSYTRAMMAGLLFCESPKSILNVGLGGGSIPKFLAAKLPEARIDVVELRKKVVQIAYQYFGVPRDPRLEIFISDVRRYLTSARQKTYDMIVLDAFDQNGMADAVKGPAFICSCKNRLNPGGVLILNLWSEPAGLFKKMTTHLLRHFDQQLLVLPVTDRSNQIAFALNKPFRAHHSWKQLIRRAEPLETGLGIGLPRLVMDLYRVNKDWFQPG